MAATLMVFDKDWTNPADFPTHENREAQVRADLQYLFNSIKAQFNNFLENEFTSDNIQFTYQGAPRTGQEIFEMLQGEIDSLVIGEAVVPAGSITSEKLATDAVITEKILNGAVTLAKMANNSVGTNQLVNGAVTLAKMANNSVGTAQLVDNCVGFNQLANYAVKEQRIDTDAVTTAKIKNQNVTADKLANDAVTTAKIADLNVTSGKLATNAVITEKILDGAVTFAKTTGVQKEHSIVGPITIPHGDWLYYTKGESGDPDYEEITYAEHEAYLSALILAETGETMTWEEYEEWFAEEHAQWEEDYEAWEEDPQGDPPVEPVKIVDEYTKNEIHSLNITVTGVSLANVATQMVNYLPANDEMLVAIGDSFLRCLRLPPAENTVTVKCDNAPEIDISLYFDIYD